MIFTGGEFPDDIREFYDGVLREHGCKTGCRVRYSPPGSSGDPLIQGAILHHRGAGKDLDVGLNDFLVYSFIDNILLETLASLAEMAHRENPA